MAEKAKAEPAAQASSATAAQASSESEAAAKSEEKTEAAAAEKAAKTESESKSETAAAEKSDGNLPFTVKDGRVAIASKARAGKKIIAKTGEVIEFDKDGKASVRAEDAAYLSACGGFEFE